MSNTPYIAHIREDDGCQELLINHLRDTALLAQNFANGTTWQNLAYSIALLHDIGKYSKDFQRRIRGSSIKVDHSTAGAQKVFALAQQNPLKNILAYVISGHHSGLANVFESQGQSGLLQRLQKKIPDYSVFDTEIKLSEIDLDYRKLISMFPELSGLNDTEFAFTGFMLTHMLFSTLVDSDFLATESFMQPELSEQRTGWQSIEELYYNFQEHMSHKLANVREPHSKLNKCRRDILSSCKTAGQKKQGIFNLTVPTGGGKTLSSMAFALEHAKLHELKRIIYVIPFTSIIEQNAQVFRECFGKNAVVEHHCNYSQPDKNSSIEDSDSYEKTLKASENWNAPIIVTTNVQFFESIFSNKTSRSRKIHNIQNSVIIFDEAQMIPSKYLHICLLAIRELVKNYGVSAVLCTATQPVLNKRENFKYGFDNITEIISNPKELFTILKRVNVSKDSNINQENVHEYIFEEHDSVLCIVNRKSAAKEIFHKCKSESSFPVYHLSTDMYPEHRTSTLNKVKCHLKNGEKTILISTQLIEAGVDIDFPVVYRASAGIDSIAQAAGRCNREGASKQGKVTVFEMDTPIQLRDTVESASITMHKFEDFMSLDAINYYFNELFWTKGEKLDSKNLLSMFYDGHISEFKYSFKDVSEAFSIIDNASYSLIIEENEEAKLLISEIESSFYADSKTMRKLQKYTINIHSQALSHLESIGAIKELLNGNLLVLNSTENYSSETGLIIDKQADQNDLIIS